VAAAHRPIPRRRPGTPYARAALILTGLSSAGSTPGRHNIASSPIGADTRCPPRSLRWLSRSAWTLACCAPSCCCIVGSYIGDEPRASAWNATLQSRGRDQSGSTSSWRVRGALGFGRSHRPRRLKEMAGHRANSHSALVIRVLRGLHPTQIAISAIPMGHIRVICWTTKTPASNVMNEVVSYLISEPHIGGNNNGTGSHQRTRTP
jgi:hypothetical protein